LARERLASDRYARLLARIADMKEEQARRKGGEEASLKRLKDEYGVTLKEAEREIPLLEKKLMRLVRDRDAKIEEIEETIR
jgi:hypothetical protein